MLYFHGNSVASASTASGDGVKLGGHLWLQRPPQPSVGWKDRWPSRGLHLNTLFSSFLSESSRARKQGPTYSPTTPSSIHSSIVPSIYPSILPSIHPSTHMYPPIPQALVKLRQACTRPWGTAGNKTAMVLPFKVSEPVGGDSSSAGSDNLGCWELWWGCTLRAGDHKGFLNQPRLVAIRAGWGWRRGCLRKHL